MKDIAVIIPVHKIENEYEHKLLHDACISVNDNKKTYEHAINTYIVGPNDVKEYVPEGFDYTFIKNEGSTDVCSQLNLAVDNIKEDFFSILEFDDRYNERWFSMASKYYPTNEEVSLFLPITVIGFKDKNYSQFANETPWAMEFSQELGFIDFQCLQHSYEYILSGGIFNTSDFKNIGGFRKWEVAMYYEYLLRLTDNKMKVMVVPKEGYYHLAEREGCLMEHYENTLSQEQYNDIFIKANTKFKTDDCVVITE